MSIKRLRFFEVVDERAIAFVTTQSAMSNDKPLRVYAFLLLLL
ncbi:hypothetical protein [Nostoc sp. 'Peltigera membranacea cyanobiont' N6]|nr:hypothetical protein [Nostoc sp. 'Peltigera membranacea cyanobiont' N6]